MGNLLSSNRIRFENLRILYAGSVSVFVPTAVGLPFANPVRMLKITNLTDANLLISFNGVDFHDVVTERGFCLYDYGSNKADQPGFLEQALGDRLYVQAITAAPTTGAVYVTVIYASQV